MRYALLVAASAGLTVLVVILAALALLFTAATVAALAGHEWLIAFICSAPAVASWGAAGRTIDALLDLWYAGRGLYERHE